MNDPQIIIAARRFFCWLVANGIEPELARDRVIDSFQTLITPDHFIWNEIKWEKVRS